MYDEGIFKIILYVSLICITAFMTFELIAPKHVQEGFQSIASIPQASFWSTFAAPRGDVGPGIEDSDYIRDPRYLHGYADVSRLGVPYDFCRMVSKKGTDDLFFTCALAGTDNLQSTSFRTASVKHGFRVSKDDYMSDINGDGRADYCRILLYSDATFQPLCLRAGDGQFDGRDVVDPSPPEEIAQLLRFYDGCEIWLRFDRSLEDSVQATSVQIAGGITIDEMPSDKAVEGVSFNGAQYLRIYDGDSLTLGTGVPLRSLRTWMVWVYFDEFTNNAKIFDFGNGPNADNVFLGILGKGDFGVTAPNESTVVSSSGQQDVEEITPQRLMETTDANVNEFDCKGIQVFPTHLPHSTVSSGKTPSSKATLLYEVWDKKTRKMRMMVNNVIPRKQWTHITITADSTDAFRPALQVYVNGEKVFTKPDGCLPSTGLMTNCYLGKSNWLHSSSLLTNKDELFKGSMFDFRAYSRPVTSDFIGESVAWGKRKLQI
jgi:hypothetical protein